MTRSQETRLRIVERELVLLEHRARLDDIEMAFLHDQIRQEGEYVWERRSFEVFECPPDGGIEGRTLRLTGTYLDASGDPQILTAMALSNGFGGWDSERVSFTPGLRRKTTDCVSADAPAFDAFEWGMGCSDGLGWLLQLRFYAAGVLSGGDSYTLAGTYLPLALSLASAPSPAGTYRTWDGTCPMDHMHFITSTLLTYAP